MFLSRAQNKNEWNKNDKLTGTRFRTNIHQHLGSRRMHYLQHWWETTPILAKSYPYTESWIISAIEATFSEKGSSCNTGFLKHKQGTPSRDIHGEKDKEHMTTLDRKATSSHSNYSVPGNTRILGEKGSDLNLLVLSGIYRSICSGLS